jgi:hypothetical protein
MVKRFESNPDSLILHDAPIFRFSAPFVHHCQFALTTRELTSQI